ncbi:MAG: protein-disulfide reductase DsbD domain-containing protein [Terracidiphilus sp.]
MTPGKTGTFIAIAATLAFAAPFALAQSPTDGLTARTTSRPPAVTYLYPEQITLKAGNTAGIELHFRVAPGLHINSHNPSQEELIPTSLTIPDDSGVRLESAAYPRGTEFALPLDPSIKLNVYTGEFTIQARIVATAGNHLVEARLRYQACDNNACMPPKTITAAIDVIGN